MRIIDSLPFVHVLFLCDLWSKKIRWRQLYVTPSDCLMLHWLCYLVWCDVMLGEPDRAPHSMNWTNLSALAVYNLFYYSLALKIQISSNERSFRFICRETFQFREKKF